MTIDLRGTIEPKSDQLNADDLIEGPRIIRIREVRRKPGEKDQPTSIFFDGDEGKPYKPCKSMRRLLFIAWGGDGELYVGRWLKLFRDPDVKFGNELVGGIRIESMSHIPGKLTVPLTATRGIRKPYTVLELKPPPNPANLLPELRERGLLAAQQGTTTYRGWWTGPDLNPALRRALEKDHEGWKRIAADADDKGAPTDGDPFGGAGESEEGRAQREVEEERRRELEELNGQGGGEE